MRDDALLVIGERHVAGRELLAVESHLEREAAS